jgi:hypothetical protein
MLETQVMSMSGMKEPEPFLPNPCVPHLSERNGLSCSSVILSPLNLSLSSVSPAWQMPEKRETRRRETTTEIKILDKFMETSGLDG